MIQVDERLAQLKSYAGSQHAEQFDAQASICRLILDRIENRSCGIFSDYESEHIINFRWIQKPWIVDVTVYDDKIEAYTYNRLTAHITNEITSTIDQIDEFINGLYRMLRSCGMTSEEFRAGSK
jgi:hypothetical protein